jgi:aerobic C4-dicarboxylate transport protein
LNAIAPDIQFRTLWGQLYIQVLIGIILGVIVGYFFPAFGASLSPVCEVFIKLIKMLLAPIIFGTVVCGMARMGSLREVGRIGLKAIIYFELLSTVALALGLILMNVTAPGKGMNIDPSSLDVGEIASYTTTKSGGAVAFLLDIIPTTLLDAFVKGAMLQVILVSVLSGIALSAMGAKSGPLIELIEVMLQAFFRIVRMIMWLAPLAAGAGIAFTIGKYGLSILVSMAELIGVIFLGAAIFVFLVLGGMMRLVGLRLGPFLRYIREEILIVAATCSTEAVLPAMLAKLESLGTEKTVVGLVLPAGYAFNADGTSLYLTGAALFVSQATNAPLNLSGQIELLAILLLTSKGSAGVAGAGFVTLAATLSALHSVPVAGIVLLLGVDRILNVPRAVVNLIGNGVATLVVARWDGRLDMMRAKQQIELETTGKNLPAF